MKTLSIYLDLFFAELFYIFGMESPLNGIILEHGIKYNIISSKQRTTPLHFYYIDYVVDINGKNYEISVIQHSLKSTSIQLLFSVVDYSLSDMLIKNNKINQ